MGKKSNRKQNRKKEGSASKPTGGGGYVTVPLQTLYPWAQQHQIGVMIPTGTMPASGGGEAGAGETKRIVTHSIGDRLERWFYRPLEQVGMNGDLSFALMTLLFPLMERYLRWECKMGDDEKFSQGHQAFNKLGALVGASGDECYYTWQVLRNGLLHRGALKTGKDVGYTASLHRDTPKAIEADGTHLKVNPYRLRDTLLPVFRSSKDMWRDEDYKLMEEYVIEAK